MKINSYLKLLGFLMPILICVSPSMSFSQVKDRVSVKVDGTQKQYDVIETKRYEIVEVEQLGNDLGVLESIAGQAISDAERDAAIHLNKTLWFSTGCFLSFIGPAISQRYQPFMPTARVLGKPPEYVAFYYDAYKVKTKKLQFNWALGGCLIGTPIGVYLLALLLRE